jgi:hypothetical protein
VVPFVWADIISDHEAVVAIVVSGDDVVSWAMAMAACVWVGTVLLFMHAEPVFVSTPIAASYVFVSLIGDAIQLPFVLKGHRGSPGVIVKERGDARGGFHRSESVKDLLLCVYGFVLFFEEVTSLLDQLSFLFCQPPFPLCKVLKLTVKLD